MCIRDRYDCVRHGVQPKFSCQVDTIVEFYTDTYEEVIIVLSRINTEKKWYPNESLKHEHLFDSTDNSFLKNIYYPTGKLKAQGKIAYTRWEYDEAEQTGPDILVYSTQYLKTGTWKFYDVDGNLVQEIDFDKESLEKRNQI